MFLTTIQSDEAFLEEELRRTAEAPIVESPVPQLKDTMFEETDEGTFNKSIFEFCCRQFS